MTHEEAKQVCDQAREHGAIRMRVVPVEDNLVTLYYTANVAWEDATHVFYSREQWDQWLADHVSP